MTAHGRSEADLSKVRGRKRALCHLERLPTCRATRYTEKRIVSCSLPTRFDVRHLVDILSSFYCPELLDPQFPYSGPERERQGASASTPPRVARHAMALPYHGGAAGVWVSTARVARSVGT